MEKEKPSNQKNRVESQKLQNAKSLYIEGVVKGNLVEAANAHIGDQYIQHGDRVKNGREGFIEAFSGVIQRYPSRDIRIVRAWEDGDYIFLHLYQRLNNGEFEYVSADFFKTDSAGRMIEHWEVIGKFEGENPSGRTQIDGEVEIKDLDKTEENKGIVKEMIENCLFPDAKPKNIEKWFSEPYIQHNPEVGDGLSTVRRLSQSQNRPLIYDEIILIIGQGNFVATLCKARWEGSPLTQMDIMRLENGKIIEHWDLNESGD